MTTIDHAPSLAVSGSGALTDDRVARRALQVARRTALGVLGAPRPPRTSRRMSPSPPSAGPGPCAIPQRSTPGFTASRCGRRCARRGARAGGARPSAPGTTRHRATITSSRAHSPCSTACQRAAPTLRYVHDMPDAAIARALRCRPGTVRSLLSRGRDAAPGARSLGEVTDAMGRRGVGVELGGLRMIIDPETSDILQTSEVSVPRRPTCPRPLRACGSPRGPRPCGQSSTPRSS